MADSHDNHFLVSKFLFYRKEAPKEMCGCISAAKLKWVSLVVLIVQTTALVLVLRYSRTQDTEGPRYLSSTAVVCAEVIKLFTCTLVLAGQHKWNIAGFYAELHREIVVKFTETLKVGIPALLYVIQNNLLFYALSRLDAATYQVTYQLKILTTALFSVTLLSRKLNSLKWISLLLLTAGVALVQMPSDKKTGSTRDGGKNGLESERIFGFLAVLAACFSSGFAGVYFEKILKGTPVSLWMRNIQLAFFSVFGGLFMVWLYDSDKVSVQGFFGGYNFVIWIVVLLQAYGGLLIALVVKYADNILKGFAVSLSIILSSVMSYWLLNDFNPSLTFFFGTTIVIASTFMYGYEPTSTRRIN
uniref:UDP-N-acetylglucosamine transporter n=1 Tax=Syphacia muris TaxID=451379 RepID=A0A0N5AFD6_9BILA